MLSKYWYHLGFKENRSTHWYYSSIKRINGINNAHNGSDNGPGTKWCRFLLKDGANGGPGSKRGSGADTGPL
jgi:hypothetical protein